jgi:hypothetical protein
MFRLYSHAEVCIRGSLCFVMLAVKSVVYVIVLLQRLDGRDDWYVTAKRNFKYKKYYFFRKCFSSDILFDIKTTYSTVLGCSGYDFACLISVLPACDVIHIQNTFYIHILLNCVQQYISLGPVYTIGLCIRHPLLKSIVSLMMFA